MPRTRHLKPRPTRTASLFFEPCGGFDCLSAKGAAIVRLRHLLSQRNYTVVFSHMQADNFNKSPPEIYADAREGQ